MTDTATAQSNAIAPAAAGGTDRLVSVDAYRGFVMLLMLAEVLHLATVARANPGNVFWGFLGFHQSHVEWVGCSLHDLIQPSFSFIVGVALPFSIAARLARGQTRGRMALHASWRALLLVVIGIFLRSLGQAQTNFMFTDTLAQIGLGYGFLFLLGFRPGRDQWIAFGLLLTGYWLVFALYPLPGAEFNPASVGVPADWMAQHGGAGFAAHWNKNSNPAWAFDVWLLNVFPRSTPFEFNPGGYATLNFIPTLATMILGLIAGETLSRTRTPGAKIRWLTVAGGLSLAAGWLLGALGVCPVVKRIWTPSWTLFSGGWCLLLLAALYFVLDVWQRRTWAFPLVVVGLNSIAAYCMSFLVAGFVRTALTTHLGNDVFRIFGQTYEPLLLGGATLLVLWLMLFWMYRRKLFLRV